jgi:hypothetical protein
LDQGHIKIPKKEPELPVSCLIGIREAGWRAEQSMIEQTANVSQPRTIKPSGLKNVFTAQKHELGTFFSLGLRLSAVGAPLNGFCVGHCDGVEGRSRNKQIETTLLR